MSARSAWCNQHDQYEEVPSETERIGGVPHDPHRRSEDDQQRQFRDKAQVSTWKNRKVTR